MPLATEGWQKTQLRKGANRSAEKHRIDKLELGVTGFGQSMFVSGLTKLG
jgi:hypothetical protein